MTFKDVSRAEGVQQERWPFRAYLYFSGADCSNLAFINVDLSLADFSGANVLHTRFESCAWARDSSGDRRSKLYRHDLTVDRKDDSALARLQSLYRMLKRNYDDTKDYELAGHFHFREMEVRQRRNAIKGWSFDRCVVVLYYVVSDYGESYVLTFWSLVLSFPVVVFLITVFELVHDIWTGKSNVNPMSLFLRDMGIVFFWHLTDIASARRPSVPLVAEQTADGVTSPIGDNAGYTAYHGNQAKVPQVAALQNRTKGAEQ